MPEPGGGALAHPPLFPGSKETYVILRNNCFSMKFQFLLSMWPTIFGSISSHYGGMKFEFFSGNTDACMAPFNTSIKPSHFICGSGFLGGNVNMYFSSALIPF